MASQRRRLLRLLRQTSFKQDKSPVFNLASGVKSRFYVDCKLGLSFPEERKLIGELIFERIQSEIEHDKIDAIGGLELGAYPIATAVSDRIFAETGKTVRVFVVRKERKSHGNRSLVAGDVAKGDSALIVDDVITSGSSAIQAIKTVREQGLSVKRVIALVDREESNGKANIEKLDVRFEALFTLKDLMRDDAIAEGTDSGANQSRIIGAQPSRALAVG